VFLTAIDGQDEGVQIDVVDGQAQLFGLGDENLHSQGHTAIGSGRDVFVHGEGNDLGAILGGHGHGGVQAIGIGRGGVDHGFDAEFLTFFEPGFNGCRVGCVQGEGNRAHLVIHVFDHPLHDLDAFSFAGADVEIDHVGAVFDLKARHLADVGGVALGNGRLDPGRKDLDIFTDNIHGLASLCWSWRSAVLLGPAELPRSEV